MAPDKESFEALCARGWCFTLFPATGAMAAGQRRASTARCDDAQSLSDQDTGVTVLRQALAVLTGSQTALPRILDAEAMLLQARASASAVCSANGR